MSRLVELLITSVVVALALFALQAVTSDDHRARNVEFFTEMAYSQAQESFGASTLLPGGLTNQPLVEGVVPRGVDVFPYGPGPEEATRAGIGLTNPFADAAPADLDRGRQLYAVYCTVCHDASGEGRGPVVLRGMLPPPSLSADRALQLPDGALFHILTSGQGNMASYAAQITPDDRWRIVSWVRQLQGGSR